MVKSMKFLSIIALFFCQYFQPLFRGVGFAAGVGDGVAVAGLCDLLVLFQQQFKIQLSLCQIHILYHHLDLIP